MSITRHDCISITRHDCISIKALIRSVPTLMNESLALNILGSICTESTHYTVIAKSALIIMLTRP
jgi:hypothetical protein